MRTRLKIAVAVARFSITGVPLAQIRFARALAAAGHDVDFIVGSVPRGLSVPDLPEVRVIDLGKLRARDMMIPLWRYLRESRPDIVFSAEDHLNAVVLGAAIVARSNAKISGSSRVSPFDSYSRTILTKGWWRKLGMQAVAWRADALTCVSKDMVDQYRGIFRSSKHLWAYNIIDDEGSRARLHEALEDSWFTVKDLPIIVGAGSLEPRKGFPDLIRALGHLKQKGRLARLVILGEGSQRPELEELIDELGLRDFVRLPGAVLNPLKYFSRADVFVLSSRAEGLPNVLIEAMMAGCTPVSTDCPTGPREALGGGEYGYLAPVGNAVALASGIEQALDNPIPKERLAEAVRPFKEEAVLARHFEILGLSSNG